MAASASAGAGGKYVNLSGVYELDRDASDKISIFLKEAGFSWATRSVSAAPALSQPGQHSMEARALPTQMADMMGLTLTVQHTEDGFTGTGKTSVGTGTYVLEVGKVRHSGAVAATAGTKPTCTTRRLARTTWAEAS